jgi:trans-2,3-dihydro-3-hydroxyanthranilate isomerase
MRELRYVVCDVFTDRALTGNQLAVFTNGSGLDVDTMQALAREMAFSETVFVWPATSGGHARIRIFTPVSEIPFAGHPTLGSAFVIGTTVQLDELRLETGKGVVPVHLEREGARVVFGWMSQPIPTISVFAEAKRALEALGLERSELPIERYDNGPTHIQVLIDSRERLMSLQPNLQALAAVDVGTTSVVAGSGLEVESRVFAPRANIPEDPATGSAAGPLALHLARHGRIGFKEELTITQGRALHRPSRLHARLIGSTNAVEAVEVGGSAVVVARGEFKI